MLYRRSWKLAMEAKDDGMDNPFTDTLLSLEWVASAMEAARRHTEEQREARSADCAGEPHSGTDAG